VATKMKPETWDKLSREQKQARILYPGQTDAQTRAEMRKLAHNEGKRAPDEVRPSGGYRSPWTKFRGKVPR